VKWLEGRRGLVFGLANEKSIAWAIARRAAEQGARLVLSYGDERLERRVRPLAEQIGAPLLRCDVSDDAQIETTFAAAGGALGGLDFLVHSLAHAEREDLLGPFAETSRSGFRTAMDVSAYSLMALARRAAPLMEGGGSILTLSYYGAEKVVPGYNVMGPAKAALEAAVRYLAYEMGPKGVRVNAISAGPIRTLAAAGIPHFRDMLRLAAEASPLRRNVTAEEVADAALFLLSNLGRAVTGEVLHVDAGYHVLGGAPPAGKDGDA
jgi:enoyl-[acyl-carrier protein] reductase I